MLLHLINGNSVYDYNKELFNPEGEMFDWWTKSHLAVMILWCPEQQ